MLRLNSETYIEDGSFRLNGDYLYSDDVIVKRKGYLIMADVFHQSDFDKTLKKLIIDDNVKAKESGLTYAEVTYLPAVYTPGTLYYSPYTGNVVLAVNENEVINISGTGGIPTYSEMYEILSSLFTFNDFKDVSLDKVDESKLEEIAHSVEGTFNYDIVLKFLLDVYGLSE